MASYQYKITAEKPLIEEQSTNGYKTVKIRRVTDINEEQVIVNSSNNISKDKENIILNFLMKAACVDLIILLLLMIVANLIKIETGIFALTSDYIASLGLLATVYSFPKIKKYIDLKVYCVGETENKYSIKIMILTVSIIVAILLYKFGVTNKFANIISFLSIVITLKNLQ